MCGRPQNAAYVKKKGTQTTFRIHTTKNNTLTNNYAPSSQNVVQPPVTQKKKILIFFDMCQFHHHFSRKDHYYNCDFGGFWRINLAPHLFILVGKYIVPENPNNDSPNITGFFVLCSLRMLTCRCTPPLRRVSDELKLKITGWKSPNGPLKMAVFPLVSPSFWSKFDMGSRSPMPPGNGILHGEGFCATHPSGKDFMGIMVGFLRGSGQVRFFESRWYSFLN